MERKLNSRYINPFTDFGFKRLFGEEANKDLLIDFLNQLLPNYHQIADLNFAKTEQTPENTEERKAIYDIYCVSPKGEHFIVEMQKAELTYFKDRSVFYTTFPIKGQARQGKWHFKLAPVYFIAILNFMYEKISKKDAPNKQPKVRRDVSLKDQDGEIFYDKLYFCFLQMPAFDKKEDELETRLDKWLYFLKNLQSFDHMPAILNEPIFEKAFHQAEIANFTFAEWEAYQKSTLGINEWDLALEHAVNAAVEEVIEDMTFEIERVKSDKEAKEAELERVKSDKEIELKKVKMEMAQALKADGLPIEKIMTYTGLSREDIENSNFETRND